MSTLKTAVEIAMEKVEAMEPIPAMTDEMGRHWIQPNRRDITVDDTHALMTLTTFNQLAEYSATNPSGVYPGKMWKRFDGSFDRQFLAKGGVPVWILCWYGLSSKGPDYCTSNFRKILLTDADITLITN